MGELDEFYVDKFKQAFKELLGVSINDITVFDNHPEYDVVVEAQTASQAVKLLKSTIPTAALLAILLPKRTLVLPSCCRVLKLSNRNGYSVNEERLVDRRAKGKARHAKTMLL